MERIYVKFLGYDIQLVHTIFLLFCWDLGGEKEMVVLIRLIKNYV